METLTPCQQVRKREYDFKVKYTFYLKEEVGFGRKQLPWQHYRCDFGYAEEVDTYTGLNGAVNGFRLFMIHPEFWGEDGLPILERREVNKEGIATMWVLDENWIPYHKRRIKIGTKGYFMEGSTKVAECEVIETNWP